MQRNASFERAEERLLSGCHAWEHEARNVRIASDCDTRNLHGTLEKCSLFEEKLCKAL